MGDGLFFWLIIVAVAVLQGIGQKKRKPGKQQPGSTPQGRQVQTRPRPRRTGPGGEGPDPAGDRRASSEGMIPSDVWEEILGLARGGPQRLPDQGAPELPELEVEEAVSLESEERAPPELEDVAPRRMEPRWVFPPPGSSLPEGASAARRSPASRGGEAVLSSAKNSGSKVMRGVRQKPPALAPKGRGKSVRAELFGDGTLKELRKAIVHQEVLGKPVSMRDDR